MFNRDSDTEERGLGCLGKLIILAVVFLLLVAAGFTGYKAYHEIFDSEPGGDYIIVDVPEGSSTQSIASQLNQEGLINSELVFRVYSRITGSDGKYQCGKHKMQMGRS
ncbi:MAG: endolytic transglycosylase MltG, partial [Oscillospiraceae bacterium]|nr:endolytic transglycosylase MltG [Oscillospiraceae bacterium]